MRIHRTAALHYHGQTHELTVPVPEGPLDIAYLEEAFGREHEKTYGHRAGADEPVELVSIQVVGQGVREGAAVPERVRASRSEPTPPPPRKAYFGSWIETPVVRRSDLAKLRTGPLIVEEYDATCVVPPGARAGLDAGSNIVIQL
jgi:N-methylhydantoinase A